MNRRLYALHRFVAAVAFVQLAIWTASGTFFTLFAIEEVHGPSTHLAEEAVLPAELAVIAPATALAIVRAEGFAPAGVLELRAMPQGLFYIARHGHASLRLDARTGQVLPVAREEAETVARADHPDHPPVLDTSPAAPDDIAYRGKPMPAWRVHLGDPSRTDVYVDARTGEITARRTRLWRTYDFLWSLHIMDYGGRESFHHLWITAMGLLAMITVLSGIVLWCIRGARWWRRRRGGPKGEMAREPP